MEAPTRDAQLLVRPTTCGDALAALDHAQQELVAAEVAQLVALTQLADLWEMDQSVVAEGMEQLIRPGHDGTPKVGEFVALEVGPILGISPSSALSRIGEALDLRARHPKLWQAVAAGRVRAWQAGKISSECAHLPLDAVLKVDEAIAAGLGRLPFARVMKALPGQIGAADTDLARERAHAPQQARQIRVSRIRDGSVTIFGVVDPVDGINFDRLLTDIAAALPTKPDAALCRDLDRRRAEAFGMLVRDAYAKAHGQEPAFELRFGECIPLPEGRVVGLTTKSVTPGVDEPARTSLNGLPGPLERARKARAQREHLKVTSAGSPEASSPGETKTQHPDAPGMLPYDIPINDPQGCSRVLLDHGAAPPGVRHTSPAGSQSRASDPTIDDPAGHGPLLYSMPITEQLEGIAGPAMPLTQTLVIHVNVEDPALGASEGAGATGVARIEDWGPLLTEQLPAFLAGSKVTVRPIIDPTNIRPVDSYETPATMRFALEQRNPVDVFPYATLKASRCDADHTNHYQEGQAGQTHLGNLGPLSRKTHRAKTHGKWKLEQPTPGVFHWTSPHGYQYQVTAAGTVRVLAADC